MLPTGNEYPQYRANEFLALNQLLSLAEQKLADMLRRSASLPLYKKRNLKQNDHFTMESFKRQPFLTRRDLIENSADSSRKNYAGRHVQLWGSNEINKATPCWFPRGLSDVSNYLEFASRLISVSGIKPKDTILVLSQPGHGSSNMLPYALAEALQHDRIAAQIIPANMGLEVHVRKWVDFLIENPPTVMIAEPRTALELAEIMGGITNKPVMLDLRLMLLYGISTSAQLAAVRQAYSTDVALALGLDGLDIFGLECVHRQGIHLWLDAGVYEIIPDSEAAKELAITGYTPAAVWLWEADRETQGDLVVTNFNEVVPLIRYRTGYRVEYAGSGDCPCGRVHPRVRLL
jgi:phenylacetate-coenzyme A ligase PaaK-like adenylate-forming protein